MYSEDDLTSAVQAGVITEEAATAFQRHVAQGKSQPAVDEEYFRLISGFNDIFVVIACALLLVSVHWIGAEWNIWVGPLGITVVAWALAEFFSRKRRMALPAIVLLGAFLYGVFATGIALHASIQISWALVGVAAWVHWQRFKVPITVAAGAAATVVLVAFSLAVKDDSLSQTVLRKDIILAVLFISGLVVFAWALRWDASDTRRTSGRSDVAFWLHFLAAPLLVHPGFALLGLFEGNTGWVRAAGVMALYIVITLVSLAIDRRAMMVSALAYVMVVFSTLLNQFGVIHLGFAIPGLALGCALLLLSAFWHPTREVVLKAVPSPLQKWFAPL